MDVRICIWYFDREESEKMDLQNVEETYENIRGRTGWVQNFQYFMVKCLIREVKLLKFLKEIIY